MSYLDGSKNFIIYYYYYHDDDDDDDDDDTFYVIQAGLEFLGSPGL